MGVEEGLGGELGLHGDELEASVLEAGDDVPDEASLYTVRLDHDVSPLGLAGACLVGAGAEESGGGGGGEGGGEGGG